MRPSRSLLFLTTLFATASAVLAGVDQQQPRVEPPADAAIGGATISQVLAQTFVAGRTGYLTEIRMPLFQVHHPSDLLHLSIQGVRAGEPDGRPLAKASFVASRFPSSRTTSFTPMPLEDPLWVSAGTAYAIVLECEGEVGCTLGPVGDLYAAGDGLYQNTTSPPGWHAVGPREDLPFQTIHGVRRPFVPIDPRPVPLAIGGPSEEKLAQAVRADTSAVVCGIELPLGIGEGKLELRIHKLVGGVPGAVLSTDVFEPKDLVPSSDGWVVLTLSHPFEVESGSEFAFSVESAGLWTTRTAKPGNPYPGGDAFYDARPNPPGWNSLPDRRDLAFAVRMDLR